MSTDRKQKLEQVEKLKCLLAEAEADLQKCFEPSEDTVAVAEMAHRILCRLNHTDGCSWEYETTKTDSGWTKFAHAKYLAIADEICNVVEPEVALAVMSVLRGK